MARASRREEVLAEAARQLNSRGLQETLASDVSQRIKISRAAIYHYVEDRQDLVFQCYRASCEVMARHMADAIRDGKDAPARLESFIWRMLDRGQPETAALTELAFLTPAQQSTIHGLYIGIIAQLMDLLEQGERARVLKPCDREIAAHVIMGFISWVPLSDRWRGKIGAVEHERAARMIVDVIFNGVACEVESFQVPTVLDLSSVALPSGVVFDKALLNELRRDTLIVTASRLFNQKGIAATPLEDIAAQVKTTKRAIIYHFGDKPSLVQACYRRTFRVSQYIIDQALEQRATGLEALATAWATLGDATVRSDLSTLYPLSGFDSLTPAARAEMEAAVRQLDDAYRVAIARGCEDGTIRPVDADDLLFVSPGAFAWASKDLMSSPVDSHRLGAAISVLLSTGIKAPVKRKRAK